MESVFEPHHPVPEEHDEVDEQTSTMCTKCWALVDGVPAGRYVRWTICEDCRKPVEPQPSLLERFLHWLHLGTR